MSNEYPWYRIVNEDWLEQGDIFFGSPVLVPVKPMDHPVESKQIEGVIERYDVIIMTQSCDLANNKTPDVILCPHWDLSATSFSKGQKESIRKGYMPRYSLISDTLIPEFPMGGRVVDFGRIFTMPKSFMEALARNQPRRLRLLPPYREHLSQAFARFFMRVGLPQDLRLP